MELKRLTYMIRANFRKVFAQVTIIEFPFTAKLVLKDILPKNLIEPLAVLIITVIVF